ncbi:hypothetical protein OPT61_g9798 [Boeremia exigua]|uniref:Uncharacterized protein n=1 Tax=Boeremia exigua TaxID=749465 RepID=A0ACC2HT36_9PLEO|nr:hypothetical protein OPT61_g9798 [Boeremia exigua]
MQETRQKKEGLTATLGYYIPRDRSTMGASLYRGAWSTALDKAHRMLQPPKTAALRKEYTSPYNWAEQRDAGVWRKRSLHGTFESEGDNSAISAASVA